MLTLRISTFAIAWAMATCAFNTSAANTRPDLLAAINVMRGIQVSTDQAKNEATNKRLDAAWTFLRKNPKDAATALRAEIAADLHKGTPDPFFVFDAADLLHLIDGEHTHDFVVDALFAVDPFNPVIKANAVQWVRLLHRLGKKPSPATLKLLDRYVLANREPLQFFDAPHWVSLDAALIGVFLYGVGGNDAEPHLLKQLLATKDSPRVRIVVAPI